ncbi:hypothetical protein [Pseudomonas sp. UMAB-40]|uniref:hypothetical protein n=1 Tax=Pseudomonas sp. UMAB-40 TaxID=1365407 RepID=UPI001C56074B|nr:hypothetical protein [Pseudomonas sp. UMAB-40]
MEAAQTEHKVFTTPYSIEGGERREATTQSDESIVDSIMRDAACFLGQPVKSMRIHHRGDVYRYKAILASGRTVTFTLLTKGAQS